MKKKFTIAILTAIMVLSAISCTTANDGINQNQNIVANLSWASHYQDICELCTEADLIAVGEIDRVINETSDKVAEAEWGPVIIYTTDFAFWIEQILKGKEAKEIILHQTGAAGKEEISDDPLFKLGEKYILFLHEYEAGKYFVLGGPQGRFKIIDDKVFSMNRVLPDKVVLDPGLDVNRMDKESFINSVVANLKNNH